MWIEAGLQCPYTLRKRSRNKKSKLLWYQCSVFLWMHEMLTKESLRKARFPMEL